MSNTFHDLKMATRAASSSLTHILAIFPTLLIHKLKGQRVQVPQACCCSEHNWKSLILDGSSSPIKADQTMDDYGWMGPRTTDIRYHQWVPCVCNIQPHTYVVLPHCSPSIEGWGGPMRRLRYNIFW